MSARRTARNASSAPYTPKIAPEAPALLRKRIPPAARHAARQRRQQIDHRKARAAEQPLHERAALVQRVHVQRDVNEAEVQERRSQQAPFLAGPGQRSEVRAEPDVYAGSDS